MTERTPLLRWLVERGKRLWQARQWDAAYRCWEQVLRFAELGSRAWRQAVVRLARLAQRRGDYAQAQRWIKQLLRLDARQARWHYWLGRLHRLQRSAAHQRTALRHLRRAVRLEPKQARYWSELGRCLADAGKPQPALRCLYRAWQLEPQSTRHLLWLVEVLLASDRFDEAKRVVEQARFLHRSGAGWQRVHAYLGLASLRRLHCRPHSAEMEPVFLPFPQRLFSAESTAISPAGNATPISGDGTSRTGSGSTSGDGSGQTLKRHATSEDEPRIIRMDPGHQLSPQRLRMGRPL